MLKGFDYCSLSVEILSENSGGVPDLRIPVGFHEYLKLPEAALDGFVILKAFIRFKRVSFYEFSNMLRLSVD